MTSPTLAVSSGEGSGSADEVLLAARFAVPELPSHHVARPRLMELLDRAAAAPLTLVSAPAGSGKTTLVAAWTRRRGAVRRTAWVTLEPDDLDPDRFWRVVLEGLRRQGVGVPEATGGVGTPAPEFAPAVARLVVAAAGLTEPVTLVLDGCELAATGVAGDLDFLLRHAGPHLRVVILTRMDPVLPLHRYRLAETVAEVRMADLAFTERETAQFVRALDVRLTAASVTALAQRTRGWAAGLRFASMVLVRSADADQVVEQLAGDRGNIAEYLMAEVLATQPEDVRTILMRTSVVDLLQPGLVEELGGATAPHVLEQLARADLLVERLADHPDCFRYHPLLRDLLRAELAYRSPTERLAMHVRAARWSRRHGRLGDAVELTVRVDAWPQAARHVVDSLAIGRLVLAEPGDELVATMRQMPEDQTDPHASVVRAALALAEGDLEGCADALGSYESAVTGGAQPGRAAVLSTAVVQALHAGLTDHGDALALLDQAMEALRELGATIFATHPELVAVLLHARGETLVRRGELAHAEQAFRAARRHASGTLLAGGVADLALIAALEGRLTSATDLASEASGLARSSDAGDRFGAPLVDPMVTSAWVRLERSDLPAAEELMRTTTPASRRARGDVADVVGAVVRSRLLRGRSRPDRALEVVERATARSSGHGWFADLLRAEEVLVRLALDETKQGVAVAEGLRDAGTHRWALARARVAAGDGAGAAAVVDELVTLRGLTPATRVRAEVLAAAADLQRGRPQHARTVLARALRTASQEQLRAPFVEAPAPVAELLASDAELSGPGAWLGTSTSTTRAAVPLHRPPRPSAEEPADARVIEPLTAKELEVLGHLSELLTTEEIASTMFVSVNTIRTHVRSILRKLAVSRRNEAVRRGRALGLVGS